MLNGIAPILIFNFTPEIGIDLFKGLAGIPLIGSILPTGIPMPIYLDEKLTGIYVESESKAIDIETNTQQRYDNKDPVVEQRGLNNLISINMLANQDSIILSALLALSELVLSKVVKKSYSITYLNGATTVFNGLLHGFSTSQGTNDNLIRIVLQLSKTTLSKTAAAGTALPNITKADNLPRPPL